MFIQGLKNIIQDIILDITGEKIIATKFEVKFMSTYAQIAELKIIYRNIDPPPPLTGTNYNRELLFKINSMKKYRFLS
jgi:hypothetical protein